MSATKQKLTKETLEWIAELHARAEKAEKRCAEMAKLLKFIDDDLLPLLTFGYEHHIAHGIKHDIKKLLEDTK